MDHHPARNEEDEHGKAPDERPLPPPHAQGKPIETNDGGGTETSEDLSAEGESPDP